ncbi:MAG: glycosyltransferase [Defluviitaleaceae bacterium]|nr:glycosyltransferase [Defluviitaleaceae bacterium]MCL2240247.1 glycosyltransferase [Defluviitaleaceae bacterium]
MYTPRISGVVTSARILEQQLARLGHRVYVFTTSDPQAPRFESRTYRLPSAPFFLARDTHRMAYFYPPKLILKIRRMHLDVVHTYTEFSLGFFGKFISQLYRIPMVHTYHTMYEDYLHYIPGGRFIDRKGAQYFSRLFCNGADFVIAPSAATHTYLREIGVRRPIRTIPTGLDFGPFHPARFSPGELAKARAEVGLAADDKVVAVIGRVAREKNIDVLVAMMPRLLLRIPKARLLIVGDGPARRELEAQARGLGVSHAVIFAGFRPWTEIAKYYRLGHVFATASTSETQGLTYAEAMAARIPVAIKKAPAFEGLVKDRHTGFIFENDADAADTIATALTDTALANRVALNAYTAVQPLSAEVFGLELDAVYKEIIRH